MKLILFKNTLLNKSIRKKKGSKVICFDSFLKGGIFILQKKLDSKYKLFFSIYKLQFFKINFLLNQVKRMKNFTFNLS